MLPQRILRAKKNHWRCSMCAWHSSECCFLRYGEYSVCPAVNVNYTDTHRIAHEYTNMRIAPSIAPSLFSLSSFAKLSESTEALKLFLSHTHTQQTRGSNHSNRISFARKERATMKEKKWICETVEKNCRTAFDYRFHPLVTNSNQTNSSLSLSHTLAIFPLSTLSNWERIGL